jgi:hypothetical protein
VSETGGRVSVSAQNVSAAAMMKALMMSFVRHLNMTRFRSLAS